MGRRRYAARDAEISCAISAGQPVRSIAAEYGLAVSTVYGIARREGWTFHNGPKQKLRFCALDGCSRPLPRPRNRFCSHDCFVAWRRTHLAACPQCGGRTKRRSSKFCSRRCYRLWLREFWAAANRDRDRRILAEARSGRPLARIADFHDVSHRTVWKVVHDPRPEASGVCAAPGCDVPLTRRRRRFCSTACMSAWNEAQRPLCENGCGVRASRRTGRFCGARCHAAFAARRARELNRARDAWIRLASLLGVPQEQIALRTGLNGKYVSVLVRRQRRPLLPPPRRASGQPEVPVR